jgi:hypothetical protein
LTSQQPFEPGARFPVALTGAPDAGGLHHPDRPVRRAKLVFERDQFFVTLTDGGIDQRAGLLVSLDEFCSRALKVGFELSFSFGQELDALA